MSEREVQPGDEMARLSAAGEARREAMLGELLGEVSRVRRRRVMRRRVVGAACMMMLLTPALWLAMRSGRVVAPGGSVAVPQVVELPRVVEPVEGGVPAVGSSSVDIQVVSTPPGIMERFAVQPGPVQAAMAAPGGAVTVEMLDDRALLRELAAMGKPCGIVRVADKTRLTCDLELGRHGG